MIVVGGAIFLFGESDVRYSFHGKMRFTGQTVDGYIEAPSSSEAIDRLADQGIIGVYTVRPDPLPQPNAILLLSGPTGPGAAIAGANLANASTANFHSAEMATGPGAAVITQLVDKLSDLVGQVEKILARPMAVYAGPVRGDSSVKSKRGAPNDAQDSALRAIFETNMDLRKSLAKLSTPAATVAVPAVTATPTTPAVAAASSRPMDKPAVVREPSHASRETSANIPPRPTGLSARPSMAIVAQSA